MNGQSFEHVQIYEFSHIPFGMFAAAERYASKTNTHKGLYFLGCRMWIADSIFGGEVFARNGSVIFCSRAGPYCWFNMGEAGGSNLLRLYYGFRSVKS